jgi:exosortase A-associated hydrolase 1
MDANMRRQLTFPCEGTTCAATLDETAATATGLLIVSGGNEIRSGAHRGMAWLAAEVAAAGYPVFRYDRRGIGDSAGDNCGFRSCGPDIAAAVATFRSEAGVQRVVAFGNCDAATALAMFGPKAGADALILANPWTFDADDEGGAPDDVPALPPASAIRARYLARLKDPRQVWRLISGGVDFRKLLNGLRAARGNSGPPAGLAAELIDAMTALPVPARILLAERDRTAMAFAEAWAKAPSATRSRIVAYRIASGSHGFADDGAREWLKAAVLAALADA